MVPEGRRGKISWQPSLALPTPPQGTSLMARAEMADDMGKMKIQQADED